jgi:hypothetical protein
MEIASPPRHGGFAQQVRFGPIYCEFNALNLAILLSILTYCAKLVMGEEGGWACDKGARTW